MGSSYNQNNLISANTQVETEMGSLYNKNNLISAKIQVDWETGSFCEFAERNATWF